MGCMLYTNNVSGASVNENAQVPFGSVVHQRGEAVALNGNEIVVGIGCGGYATVSGTANLVAAAAGDVTLTINVDGVQYVTVTDTAAAAGDYVVLPFEFCVRGCRCNRRRITATVNAAISSIASFPVVVETK